MLEVVGLTCSRNDRVLFKDLCFKINPGSGLQICAANGAGKTSLLKIIAGILPKTHGQVHATGAIFYLGHRQNIHPALTSLQNLQYLHSLNSTVESLEQNTDHPIQQALAFVSLTAEQHTLCGQLSAGQQHRLNLARLHLSAAKIWLLDEPFANLDSVGQLLLLDLLTKHLAAGGILVFAAHTKNSLAGIQAIELSNYA